MPKQTREDWRDNHENHRLVCWVTEGDKRRYWRGVVRACTLKAAIELLELLFDSVEEVSYA